MAGILLAGPLLACASDAKHAGYEEAARMARKNHESPRGRLYAQEVRRALAERRLRNKTGYAIGDCYAAAPDTRGVQVLFRLDSSGHPLETIVYPESEFGACVEESFQPFFPLPEPPRPDYWFSLSVPIRRGL